MPSEKSISFRTHLLSNTTDLLGAIDLHCARTAKLIVSIISQLAAYTEEGIPLAPTVFICNSVSHLIRRAGAGEYIPLSGDQSMETASAKILKAAAPLCSDNWRIYVERSQDGDRCRFGVFCGSSDPAALTVDEIVLDGLEVGFPIIRIAQSVTNKVELQTNIGDGIEFRFNDDADVPDLDNKRRILDLANIVASALAPQGSSFSGYVARLLTTAIRESHGTLIAVVSDDTNVLPVALQDAISLDPPLDLYERHRLHHEEGATAASVSRLQVASELVSGFVRSDGITVLNTCGKVLGYRAFIHMDSPTQPSAGGARSRAFAAMVGLLGTQLKAAFFRSEDGRMEMRIAAESAENG